MATPRELAKRIAGLLRGRRADDELRDELRFHTDMLEDDLRRRGVEPLEARRLARAQLGGVAQVSEAYGDQRTLPWIEALGQDLRYGVRMLARTPSLTFAAVLTLALGIGATTAIFSVVHAVLLRPLPYVQPDRLVTFGDAQSDGQPSNIGFATWQDYRDRTRAFESTALIRSWLPTLSLEGEAERIPAVRVSWNFFDMLGARPALGRSFRADEDAPDRSGVVIISDGLWRRRFGADPNAVGRTVRMNDRDYQVVGVMPPGFEPLISQHFYTRAEMWGVLGYDTTLPYACRGCQHLRAVGRLRAGVTVPAAKADLDAIRTQLAEQYPDEYPRGGLSAVRLQDKLAGPVRGTLITLLVAVGLVLLIACANVANLLLARATERSREMAVRAALGAGRGRLLRQLITESLVLAAVGGALGVATAALGVSSLAELAPVSIPRLDQAGIDTPVLLFAAFVSIATGVLFGTAPARRGAGVDLQSTLSARSRTSVAGGDRGRRLLIVADLALALVLLSGAGLMLKSVSRLWGVDPGFDPHGVLTLQYSLVGAAYREDPAVLAFTERVVERVDALPGAEAVAAAGQIPMGGNGDTWGFHIQGRVPANTSESPSVERYSVTPDYFRVMRIPIKRGRGFSPSDRPDSQPVIVVSESTARALWPGGDPIGHRVRTGDPERGPWRTVIGIAGDVRHTGLDTPATMQMYLPQSQVTDSYVVLVVRTDAAPEGLASAARAIIREIDPAVPVYDVAVLQDLVARSVAPRQFVSRLLGGFAGLAVLLAAVGLYGVVSYTVAQRRRELALRVALGADRAEILRLIAGVGVRTVAAGVAVGLVGSILLVRLMGTLLFEVEAGDPQTLMAATAVLVAVASAAHWVPARRALQVDPAVALRQD
jgi:putative ABC transport system permease protein